MKLENTKDISELIKIELTKIITEDYVLLDLPNYGNIGDQLIYKGELDFLKQLPYDCISSSSITFNFSKKINANTILIQGGGNFGDLYPIHQEFREKIIEENLNKKIIILPQSVHFEKEENAIKSAKIFNRGGNVTICARDDFSFNFLKTHFTNCNIIMVPDMAFCSNYKRTQVAKEEILIMKRRDFELDKKDNSPNAFNYPEIDWPTFENSNLESLINIYRKINNNISKAYYKTAKTNSVYGLLPIRNEESYIKLGIDFLSDYKFVITTRLHGHILCILLGIPSIIIDNSYGKNKRFYKAWLEDIPDSYYANTIEEGLDLYHKLHPIKTKA